MSGGRKKVHTTWDDIGIEMVEEYDPTTDQLLLRKVGAVFACMALVIMQG